jgi:hypothetical protein
MCDGMSAAGGTPIAVMNPASGPGTAANPDYQQVIGYCHGRGRHVVSYVHTSYGARPLAAVQAEIDATYAFYPAIDGIFLDEMSTDSSTRTYYRALYAYVKAKRGFHDVVGNPGAAASTSWQLDAPVADQVVVFEGHRRHLLALDPAALGDEAPQPGRPPRPRGGGPDRDHRGVRALEGARGRLVVRHRRHAAQPMGHAARTGDLER